MIPKIIHYCWFGGKDIPMHLQTFIDGWKEVLGKEYSFKRWDESNSPMEVTYMKNAYAHGKWANLSNYARLHALYQEGGIYFDTDIELLQPLDQLLEHQLFLGFQDKDINQWNCVNNAVIGSVKAHPFIKGMMDAIEKGYSGEEKDAAITSPDLTTKLLRENGLKIYGFQTLANGVVLYPTEYFYPYHWKEKYTPNCKSPETVCVHHWQISWKEIVESQGQNKSIFKLNSYLKFKNRVRKLIKL
jgi:mannosyltransferase OCH1-like enzyme